MKQKLLPTAWYYVTLRKAWRTEETLFLCFTVDTGEFSYRNLIEEFSLTETGLNRLENLFYSIGKLISTKIDSPFFLEQFKERIRAHVKVERRVNDNVVENIITEFKIPLQKEKYNVLKPKTEEHYHESNTGRDLPIQ